MVLSKKPSIRKDIKIITEEETISHSTKVKILDIEVEETLSWKFLLADGPKSVLKQINTCQNSLKLLKKYATTPQMKQFANGILM